MSKQLSSRLRAVGGVVLFLAALPVCSRKERNESTVAVVGGDEIQVQTITDAFQDNLYLFKTAEQELAEKEKLLNLLVEERILIREAYRQKLEQDSLIRAYDDFQRPLFLMDHLYYREVRDRVRPSEKELLSLYRELKNDRCLKQLAGTDKKLLEELAARLQKGEPFDTLVRRIAKTPGVRLRGADLGCIGWQNRIPNNFEETLRLKAGGWTGPLGMPDGWAILYCYDLRAAQPPEYEEMKLELRNVVEAEREARRSAQLVREIREKMNFQVVESTLHFATLKQEELSKKVLPGGQVLYSSRIRTGDLSPSERNMPLLTFRGGVFTVGQYLEALQGTIPASRPVLDTSETSRARLFQLIFRDAMARAARERGVEQDPAFQRAMKQAVEGQMALLLKKQIFEKVKLDSAAAKVYFDAHPDEFVVPTAYHLFEINLPEEKELLRIKAAAKNRSDFAIAASQRTARERLRESGGDMGWVEQFQFPELFAAASKLKVGQAGGPVKLADGSFSLIFLDEKRPARKQPFAEVRAQLYEKLLAQAEDSAYAAWMAKRRGETKVVIYPEVLKKTIDHRRYARLKELEAKKTGGRS
jgi:parvulin-like peptidyl-prolyl isomerase